MWERTDPSRLPPIVDGRTDQCDPIEEAERALGGPPDTDNVDGVWIISHDIVRGPVGAIVQAMQQGALWPGMVPNRLVADRHTLDLLSRTTSLAPASTLTFLSILSSGSHRSPSGPLRSLLMWDSAPFQHPASRGHSHLANQPGQTSTGNTRTSEVRRLSR